MLKALEYLVNSILGKGTKTQPGCAIKGTGKDKLQPDIEFKLIQQLKFFIWLAMKEMPFIDNEEEKIAVAQEKMKACRLHVTGDHTLCNHEGATCREHREFLLQDRFSFGEKQRDLLVQKLFIEKVETEKWVKDKLIKPGNTSGNENYHSLMITRGLVNKDSKVDVEQNTIDAKYALGTYFYNLGSQETFANLFNYDEKLNWKICDQSIRQLGQYEQRAKTNVVQMRKKKARELAKRSKQAKWQCNPRHLQEPGTYLTARQKRKNSLLPVPIKTCNKRKK